MSSSNIPARPQNLSVDSDLTRDKIDESKAAIVASSAASTASENANAISQKEDVVQALADLKARVDALSAMPKHSDIRLVFVAGNSEIFPENLTRRSLRFALDDGQVLATLSNGEVVHEGETYEWESSSSLSTTQYAKTFKIWETYD